MHLRESEDLGRLRAELRDYFAEMMTEQVRAALRDEGPTWGETTIGIRRRLGGDGWLGVGWPTEYGGRGMGPHAQFLFYEEAYRADVPFPMITMTTVGPTLMAHGTPAQKEYFLPRILAGELAFAIGYTEPESGTDLASLRTRAMLEPDGAHYRINGNKIFTSGGTGADWIWLAARTDPQAPKHRGITLFLVPTADPGFSATPIKVVGRHYTSATYYQDVVVPAENIVGEVNRGWQMITAQLNHERVGLAAFSGLADHAMDKVLAWSATATTADGTPVLDQPWVRPALAGARARIRAMQLLNWRLVERVDSGDLSPGDASAAKVFGTETAIETLRTMYQVMGTAAMRPTERPWLLDEGMLAELQLWPQINTFGGGVAEVQREIVAWTKLGMTRSSR